MTRYPLTVSKIASWYRSKQRSLQGSGLSLVQIREGESGPKPGTSADFDGLGALGQISGWVSGEFDFHVLRVADGKDIFWRHLDVYTLDELEDTYADFLRNLQNPGSIE